MTRRLTRFWGAAALCTALALPMAAPAKGISGDYLAARQASFAGDFAAAARYYSQALAFDATNAEILERAALANLSLGDIAKAAGYADRLADQKIASQIAQMARIARDVGAEQYAAVIGAVEADRGLGPLADGLVKAWALLGQGDMSAALLAFDEVSGIQGLGPFAAYHKSLALASVGDFESAASLMDSPEAAGMMTSRGAIMAQIAVLTQVDRFDEAQTLLTTVFGTDLDPGLAALAQSVADKDPVPFDHVRSPRDGIAEVFFTLASALSNDDGDEIVLIYARLAQFLREDHTAATLLAAQTLDQMGQFELASSTYAEVPADDPDFHAAELGRAEALRRQDKVTEAEKVLRALKETHGDLPVVHSNHADLLRQMEKFDEAITAYTEALALYDEITERQWFLYYARGISHERLDQWPQAEADFRKALELRPDQPNVLNYLGYSLVQKKIKLDEALDMIQRAVAERPDSGYIVDSLGWVLFKLGRYEESVVHMERAAELMPIDPIVNDHLGDVYWSVGRTREAEFMWKRALSFADWGDAAEEADVDRIRRKLEVGLDVVLAEEGADPLHAGQVTGDNDGG